MKKIGVLCLFLFLIAGCADASNEMERGMMLRSSLLQSSGCSFDAEITADYGAEVYQFEMKCISDSAGNLQFTVTAPASISGITGEISQSCGKLIFEEKALEFDLMADDRLSPVSVPWIFVKTLRSGYITSVGMEDNFLRLTIDDSYDDDALHLDIWLDENNVPIHADVLHDGCSILSLNIENFVIL